MTVILFSRILSSRSNLWQRMTRRTWRSIMFTWSRRRASWRAWACGPLLPTRKIHDIPRMYTHLHGLHLYRNMVYCFNLYLHQNCLPKQILVILKRFGVCIRNVFVCIFYSVFKVFATSTVLFLLKYDLFENYEGSEHNRFFHWTFSGLVLQSQTWICFPPPF